MLLRFCRTASLPWQRRAAVVAASGGGCEPIYQRRSAAADPGSSSPSSSSVATAAATAVVGEPTPVAAATSSAAQGSPEPQPEVVVPTTAVPTAPKPGDDPRWIEGSEGALWPDNKENRKRTVEAKKNLSLYDKDNPTARRMGAHQDNLTRVRNLALGQTDLNQHFLLMDLDFRHDSVVFGSTREEFRQNIERVKQVVIEYQRWDAKDKYYLWGTRILQLGTAWFTYDTWEHARLKALLCTSLPDFAVYHEEELRRLKEKQQEAIDAAVELLEKQPPSFEKAKAAAAAAATSGGASAATPAVPFHPMDTTKEEQRKQAQLVTVTGATTHSVAATSDATLKALRRILLPQTDDYVSIVREEMYMYQRQKFEGLKFPRAV